MSRAHDAKCVGCVGLRHFPEPNVVGCVPGAVEMRPEGVMFIGANRGFVDLGRPCAAAS